MASTNGEVRCSKGSAVTERMSLYTSPAKNESGNDFATIFKSFRESKGVSQAKLARLVGCDHSYISRLESGERFPSAEMVDDFIKALQLDENEAVKLRVSSGYVGVENIIPHEESALLGINKLLTGNKISDEEKDKLRAMLTIMGDMALRASEMSDEVE